MSTSSPLRLDRQLVKAASAVAGLFKRTTPRQIEYWAELGRAVEKEVDPDTIIALREGLVHLRVETVVSTPITSEDVFNALESDRSHRVLSDRVSSAKTIYQACQSAPGFLEQIQPDGTVTIGRFHDGKFKPTQYNAIHST